MPYSDFPDEGGSTPIIFVVGQEILEQLLQGRSMIPYFVRIALIKGLSPAPRVMRCHESDVANLHSPC